MASFTDQVPQFTPYVSQLPVDAMVKVGMEKQKRYEEGVQKIQTYIDNIAGLDIIRDVDKGYLQSKLNQLGNNLTSLAGADYSNFQLVNSVSGMANQIAKDKFVQAAVQSTANHRKQQALMEEERKKGTLTPDNELNYTKQLSNYLSNNDLGTEDGGTVTFSGQYKPYFDVFKFAKETFDAEKPDNFSFDQVYVTDANGKPVIDKATGKPVFSPVLVRMEKEGIFPKKVKDTLDQIFSDPRVAQQLQITGEYNFRNLDSDALFNKIDQQRTSALATVDQALLDLNNRKKNGQDVSKQMDDLMKKRQTLISNYQQYADLAIDNPDAVRGQMYKDDINDRYTTMFGWTKTKETYNDNPGWKANFEIQKELNAQSRWAQQFAFDKEKHKDELLWKKLEYEQKDREIAAKYAPTDKKFTQADQSSGLDLIGKVKDDYERAASTFSDISDEFIWQNYYEGMASHDADLERLMTKSNMTRPQAIAAIMNKYAKDAGADPIEYRATIGDKAVVRYNKLSPEQKKKNHVASDTYEKYSQARRDFDGMRNLKNAFLKDPVFSELGSQDDMFVTYNGNKVKITAKDIYDMAVVNEGHKSILGSGESKEAQNRSKDAYERLNKKGLGDIANLINSNLVTADIGKNPISGISTWITSSIKRIGGAALGADDNAALYKRVRLVVDKLRDSNYVGKLEAASTAIKNKYSINPDLQGPIFTGKAEDDKKILYNLGSLAAGYSSGNYSTDFSKFLENLPTADKLDEKPVSAHVVTGKDGVPRVEIIVSDKSGRRMGGMTLSDEEALNSLGINVNDLYQSPSVSILKNSIMQKGGKSCTGDITDPNTYESGDYIFNSKNYPGLSGSKFDVKVNFQINNGKYYPFAYVWDGVNEPVVHSFPGVDNLEGAVNSLSMLMTPQYVQNIINLSK